MNPVRLAVFAAWGVWLALAGDSVAQTAVVEPPAASADAGSAAVDLIPTSDTAAVLSARAPTDVNQLRLIQDQLQRVLEVALPATAAVEIGRAAGSGVVVSRDGLVLTAAHVIGEPGQRARIELADGRRLRGVTLGANHEADAGMIRIISPPPDLPFTPIAEGPPPEPGAWVVTIGQPGGVVRGRAPPVRLGRVLFRDDELLCTDCKLVGGDSGGPLFNMQGQVVGIHSSIGPMLTHNFHVPITAYRASWDRLLSGELWGGRYDEQNERRAVLGVSGIGPAARCEITQVVEGMPAANAGVRVGDVITAVDGEPISSFDDLKNYVAEQLPGESIRMTIRRGGETIELVAQLARPDGTVPPPQRPPSDNE